MLLGDAARAAAEADVVKLRKEMAIASAAVASSASPVNIDELVLAKETLQAQLNSERRRLQQLEHDHLELQQQEHMLQAKVASIVSSAVQKESEHAAALAELRQQQQQWQAKQHNGGVKAEGSDGPLHRTASVEHSLSEGDLAQRV